MTDPLIMTTNWWSFQLFKSKLIGKPLYHEILTATNNIFKVVFFEGVAFNRNDVGTFVYPQHYSNKYGLNLDYHDLQKLSPAQMEILDQMTTVGIIKPTYETHPYHKLKNPLIVGYQRGPKFEDLVQVFAIPLVDVDLIVESDIIAKEKIDEQI